MSTDEPTRPRVLAIDDSDLVHRLLRARLRHERIDLHAVHTGEDGLKAARESTLPRLRDVDVLEDVAAWVAKAGEPPNAAGNRKDDAFLAAARALLTKRKSHPEARDASAS